ncbi:MAG: hypothetical protein WAL98_20980 [Desulfatiglandaceae bacterium]
MKKPARLKTTARLFPDKESEATTATSFTSEGRITDPLPYCPSEDKEYLSSHIFKKGFDPYPSRIEPLEKASEAP